MWTGHCPPWQKISTTIAITLLSTHRMQKYWHVSKINSARKWVNSWGRETHICVGKLTIIGSDNGLSPGRRQAIIWNNAGILLIWPLGTNFNEILIKIHTFSINKMHLKMSSAKRRPFCLGLNVLTFHDYRLTLFREPWMWLSDSFVWSYTRMAFLCVAV